MGIEKNRLIRREEVLFLCGISRSAMYEQISHGQFPTPVRVGARAVAWRLSDVLAWISSRPNASDTESR